MRAAPCYLFPTALPLILSLFFALPENRPLRLPSRDDDAARDGRCQRVEQANREIPALIWLLSGAGQVQSATSRAGIGGGAD